MHLEMACRYAEARGFERFSDAVRQWLNYAKPPNDPAHRCRTNDFMKPKPQRKTKSATRRSVQPDCSTPFVIAAKTLLRQWMTKHAGHYRPGGWDYDEKGASLVQATADLLGVKDPWKQ